MCANPPASTKLPSPRESRARVARQYRAAACAEMLCSNLFCVWLMFNTLKVAQAEKQIYPERFTKDANAGAAKRGGTIRLRQGQEPAQLQAQAVDAEP